MNTRFKRKFKSKLFLGERNWSNKKKSAQTSENRDLQDLSKVMLTEENDEPVINSTDSSVIDFLLKSLNKTFIEKTQKYKTSRKTLKKQLKEENKLNSFLEKENLKLKETLAKLLCVAKFAENRFDLETVKL